MSLDSRDLTQIAEITQSIVDREIASKVLTLRDQFAMAALAGLYMVYGKDTDEVTPDDVACMAYAIADSMLKARGEG